MNTLVLQTAFLGDLVMTLPLIRRLKEEDAGGRITLAVRPGLAEFAAGQPGVDEVLAIRKRRGWLRRLGHDRGTLRALRAPGFDAVYLAHKSFRSGLHARLSGAARRVGFRGTPSAWGCTVRVPFDERAHAVERYLALAGPPANGNAERLPRVRVSAEARRECGEILAAQGIEVSGTPFVSIMPGSVWATKCWTAEGFAAVARWCGERGYRVILDGSPDEHELCERVRCQAGGAAVNIAGTTSLPVLAATLEAASLLVGNDSGPAHVAAAVGTPVVAVYGPTAPQSGLCPAGPNVLTTGLDNLACRPCGRHGARRCPLGHHRCMRDLSAAELIREIDRWPLSGLRDKPRARPGERSSPARVRPD